ncbi:MAG: LURP-one-related family protein [Eubacterium sp.]|nr:LURP-one-related family protein [Eubacterium sp.]
MGFFDKFKSSGSSTEPKAKSSGMGFASVANVKQFTNEDLLEKLSGITVSFGTPIMGDINGTQSVMYKKVTEEHDIFVRVDKDKIIMGKIGTDGVSAASSAFSAGLDMMFGGKSKDTATADRAVDELMRVVQKLESGEEVSRSAVAEPANTATGEAEALFMKQKLTIANKFDIFDQSEATVYHVEGGLTGLGFSVQRNGEEVLKINKKMVAVMPSYTIVKDKVEIGKLKKKMKFTAPEVTGTINGQELTIRGDLLGYDFDIQVGGTTIGHIDKDMAHWTDCFRIQILDSSQRDLMVAMAIICDNVVDQDNNR